MGDAADDSAGGSALSSPAETSRLLAVDADDVVLDCLGDVSYDELLGSLLTEAQAVPDERLAPPSPPRGCVRRRCCCGNGSRALPPDIEAARTTVRKMAKVCRHFSASLAPRTAEVAPRGCFSAGQDGR